MSARIDAAGRIERLDGKAEPTKSVEESDVKDAGILVRLLRGILADIAALKRRAVPQRITFPSRSYLGDGVTKYRLQHDFGCIPDLLVVRWNGVIAANFIAHADTDERTLVVVSLSEGTGVIRLEAS